MQDRVYQTAVHDVDELKQCLIAVWADMKQSVINKAIDEWRSRVAALPWCNRGLREYLVTTVSFCDLMKHDCRTKCFQWQCFWKHNRPIM